jgi:hypothetical protein
VSADVKREAAAFEKNGILQPFAIVAVAAAVATQATLLFDRVTGHSSCGMRRLGFLLELET